MLQIYNTLTQTKERFKPLRQELVKVYYCGPTPYDYAHIGNLRAYLFSDTVVRTLRYLGYPVQTVMNVTDIDDKTIRDSQKSGKSLQEFTEFFTEAFFTDLGRLHIQRADTVAPISTLIDDMVVMIQGLIDKGYAYLADDGSIYYRVDKFKTYGQLAHLDMKGMKAGARVNSDEYEKESVADFALWKAYDQEVDGPNKWDAHFIVPTSQTGQISHEGGETEGGVRIMYSEGVSQDGMGNMPVSDVVVPGRPGWHIECSACNMRYFGPQIDIHMGAIDNLFPHHQNEVAQTEAYTGKKFAGYWMHGGHLLVDNAKMSKSKKNFYTLSEIVEKVPTEKPDMVYRAFRLMTLQTQYRENFNFTFDRLAAAIQTIKSFDEVLRRLKHYQGPSRKTGREFRNIMQEYIQAYIGCLEDDFSTTEALAIVFDSFGYVNSGIDTELFSSEEVSAILDLFRSFDSVLGLFDFSLLEDTDIPAEIQSLLTQRNDAKQAKDYVLSDSLRDQITALGYRIVDDKAGSRVEKI